jgi:hypothetical protein
MKFRAFRILAPLLGGVLFLAACTSTEVSDAQAVVNDANAALATGLIPPPASTIAGEVVVGLQSLINAVSPDLTTNANAETTAIAALTAAVRSVQDDASTNSTVTGDAATALSVLGTISANSSASSQGQLEADVGELLIDYLAANAPAAATAGSTPTAVQSLINDARTHISHMRG